MATLVRELELTNTIVPLVIDSGYESCRILVRYQKMPLRWVSLPVKTQRTFSPDQLLTIIAQRLGRRVVEGFLFNRFKPETKGNHFFPISVVVCTRDRTASLSSCLAALSQVIYPEYEIIVVDNAPSNNDTEQLVAGLPVRYVRENRPGLDWARNRGISEAKYDFVAFTDDDAMVDTHWLHAINQAFENKEIMAVSGFVAPAELDTPAQLFFESGYGGMAHGFERKYFSRASLGKQRQLWASAFGIGVNMAFRKKVFEDVGDFNVAFDVGTPTHGGGDVEMFFRLVNSGLTMMYEPSMLVWHSHRKSLKELRRQISDNGRSTGCFLIHVFRQGRLGKLSVIRFFLVEWLLKWNLRNLIRKKRYFPRWLSVVELSGMMTSPFAYFRSLKMANRLSEEREKSGR